MARTRTKTKTTKLDNGTKVVRTTLVPADDLEWELQAEAVRRLRTMPGYGTTFTLAGDFNAARRGPRERVKAKATGLTPGEHDLRIYITGGLLGLIEMKADKGRLDPAQAERHALLFRLGFMRQAVVRAKTAAEAADKVCAVVASWIPANDNA